MALELCAEYHIVAVGKTTGALEALDDEISAKGGAATLAPMDITVDAAMQQLCRSIYERWGKLDLWVHSAVHAAPLSPAAHQSEKDFTKSVAVNVAGTERLIRYVSPLLGQEGQAVFFDDPKGGAAYFGSYGSTKAAQLALVKSWQAESAKTGPKVSILSPAPMATATRARFHPGEDQSALAKPRDEAARLLKDLAL